MPSQIQKATVQASLLNIASSVLAQLLRHYRTTGVFDPFAVEIIPVLQFLFWCLASTPPNFIWQEYLENKFPGYPSTPEKQKVKVDDDGKGAVVEKKLDIKNTAIKFLLDQTIGAAANNAGFLVGITAVRGGSWNDCMAALHADFWPVMFAAMRVWPAVSLINFLIVPVERRIVVGSAVGLFWGIYMVLRVT